MSPEHVDVDRVPLAAFGLAEDYPAFAGDWHAHRRHQLLFAASGTLDLETEQGRWLLPCQRAAWLAGGVRHRVRSRGAVALRTVYFEPAPDQPAQALCVFSTTPLAREMIRQATRWGPDDPRDAAAVPFFAALGALCRGWTAAEIPGLPRAQTAALQGVLDAVLDALDDPPSRAEAARAAGLSPRSLARRFAAETQTTWREYLRTARMLRAMELLAQPGARVSDVALAVGYDSFSAFSHAFRAFTGEAPRTFRQTLAQESK